MKLLRPAVLALLLPAFSSLHAGPADRSRAEGPLVSKRSGRTLSSAALASLSTQTTGAVLTVDSTAATTSELLQDGVSFRITRSGDLAADLTVEYTLSGTADEWDYSPRLGGSVTINAGQDTAFISFGANRDSLAEPDETLTLTIKPLPDRYTVGAGASATITILDSTGRDYTPRKIHEIQGADAFSPLLGQAVGVEAVVVGVFPALGGFFLQEEDADADANPNTSEGIFVQSTLPLPAVGRRVKVVGTVTEFGRMPASETRIHEIKTIEVLGNATLPKPRALSLPFNPLDRRSSEGMRVTFAQKLTVTDTARLLQFGQVLLSGGGRHFAGTESLEAGDAAQALTDQRFANQLLLDDGSLTAPTKTPYLLGGSNPARQTLRAGDTVTGLTGVISYVTDTPDQPGASYEYRLHPTQNPAFVAANPRPAAPKAGGALRLVSLDLGAYSNGNGQGGGFGATPGAAGDATEFARQRDHVVAQLRALRPDLVGLQGLENDGQGPDSSLQDIVKGLNAAEGGSVYAALDLGGPVGGDALASGFVYRLSSLEPVGKSAVDTNAVHDRPPVLRSWRAKNGEVFTVALSHLRSRGASAGASGPDDFQADGQAYFNDVRIRQAIALREFLATNPTGLATSDPDLLLLGNLNAYTREDPLAYLGEQGFRNLLVAREGAVGYTALLDGVWGRLHHALASASLEAKVTRAAAWHANADEPALLDYNTENKDPAALARNAGATPWRAAAADPLVIDFNPARPPR